MRGDLSRVLKPSEFDNYANQEWNERSVRVKGYVLVVRLSVPAQPVDAIHFKLLIAQRFPVENRNAGL
jgi:hypothetical protein